MGKNKKETLPILLDLHYKYSSNHFEEFYGYGVTYASVEQESYIDLKEMSFDRINKNIKFRKFGRYKGVLTVKMDIKQVDFDYFVKIMDSNEPNTFNFLHDFTVSNVRPLTTEEKIKFKKVLEPNEEEGFDLGLEDYN